jgi:PAS domain S-box-containing protein
MKSQDPSTSGPNHLTLAESAPDPIVTIDEASTILFANSSIERVFGYAPEELVGKSLLTLIPERLHARHEAGIAHYIASGNRRIAWQGIRVPARSKAGLEIPVEISFGEFEWNGRRVFSGFLRDVSERVASDVALSAAHAQLQEQAAELEQQVEEAQALSEELAQSNAEAEERARLEHRAAERARSLLTLCTELNKAIGESEVADRILENGMQAVGADAAALALVSHNEGGESEFEIVRTRGFRAQLAAKDSRFPLVAGRPLSDAVLTRAPVFVQSREESQLRYPILTDVGREGFAAVPVLHDGEAVAAIAFSFSGAQHFDEATETFLRTVGEQCAQALERSRLYDARDRQAERSAFLAEASRVLASSLDYEVALQAVAELAVPTLADWCAVDIVEDPTVERWPPVLTRLAVAHSDPEMKELGLSLQQRFPTDWSAQHGTATVLRERVSQFIPIITPDMLARAARSEEHLAILKALKFTSVIMIPLLARGLTLGMITLVMGESGRRYDRDDLALATDLATRAATAIDNARLFHEAQHARLVAEEATARAALASQAKSNFLATMSHEIRTPINAVLGYSELLALELAGPLTEEQRAQLMRIRASTDHLLALVDDVLDLSKIESGTLRVQLGEERARDAVDTALSLVRPQAVAKGVALDEEARGDCEERYAGDASRVRQILANLISNAIKFTDAGGEVSVGCASVIATSNQPSLRIDHPYVAFEVRDNGIGIVADQLENIFEAFVQAEREGQSLYTREQTGTGLGLAISRQLARRMDGDITVASRPGIASVFTLYMPRASATSPAINP